MASVESERDPLDLLAEEFADRVRRGERPSVTDYANRHPEFAEELQQLLPAVAQMELLKRHRQAASDSHPIVEPAAPTKLGDYRIVRELGRGGMGVVFEAVQESLGRKVALKVLPAASRRDSARRERFLREAQAAAKLHHTNIVPVFGVGEADGVPYIVMQFISGCTLHDVIADWQHEKPTSDAILRRHQWKKLARLGAAAADALHYAHAQGILHRDVKPGNLLLDPRGNVWVADFGLAKLNDRETLTTTGNFLGTMQYMPPEAFHGQSDARSDIYGLGLTLYELAVGRLPFDDTTPAVLLKDIRERELPPPHELEPKIPADLETIILKATAREPSRRYATAEELAADLLAFSLDEPIRARRSSLFDRAYLWTRRNPNIAALSLVTVLALIFAAVSGWTSYVTARNALAMESQLRRESDEASRKLSENLNLSLQAFEQLFESITDEPFGPGPGFIPEGRGPDGRGPEGRGPEGRGPEGRGPDGRGGRPFGGPFGQPGIRSPMGEFKGGPPTADGKGGSFQRPPIDAARMVESLLSFYEKFAEQNATNPKLQMDAAKAYRRVGQLRGRMGDQAASEAALMRSMRIIEQVQQELGDTQQFQHEWVMSVVPLPPVPTKSPQFTERLRLFGKAAELSERVDIPRPAMFELFMKWAEMADANGNDQLARQIRRRAERFNPRPR